VALTPLADQLKGPQGTLAPADRLLAL